MIQMDVNSSKTLLRLKSEITEKIINEKEAFFKSQQLDEEDLSVDEKRSIVETILDANIPLFLQRYGQYLDPNMLIYFDQFNQENNDISSLLTDLRKALNPKSIKIKANNRRYEAMKNLIDNSDYFSDSQMQIRNPLLYERMVGQYLDDDERRVLAMENMHERHERATFSTFLMEQMQKSRIEETIIRQEEFEQNAVEEFDSDNEDDVNVNGDKHEECPDEEDDEDELVHHQLKATPIDPVEKEKLRSEFRQMMYENFLCGKDEEFFDYKEVDKNSKYDCVIEEERDEEDKYFDDESPG